MDLCRLVPDFVRSRLAGRTVVRRVLGNSGWMFADRIWRMALSLLVGVWVARYLGPERFGRLSYAMAFVELASPLASLGLTGVLVRDFVRNRLVAGEMLGTAAGMKLLAGTCMVAGCVIVGNLTGAADGEMLWLVLAVAAGPVFQGLDVFDSWLQAEDRYREGALVRTLMSTALALARVVLILAGAPLLAFAVVGGLETALCGLGWLVVWWRRPGTAGRLRWSAARASGWLAESWPLIVSGFSMQVQVQFDQVLIGRALSADQLGQYAAAVRLVMGLSFVPMVLQAASAPEVARARIEDERTYLVRLHRLYRLMVVLTLGISLGLALFPGPIVRLLLGAQFSEASVLLHVVAFRLVLIGLGVVRTLYLSNEGLFRIGMVSTAVGAGVSLGLNLTLIPRWGLWGAVVASIASLTLSTVACDLLMPAMRLNSRLMLRALFMPWRELS